MDKWLYFTFGNETPWIEGRCVIKKGLLTFDVKLWWFLIKYRLFPITSNNVLTYEGAALIASVMVGYNIHFAVILQHEINDRAFGKVMNLSLPTLFRDCVMRSMYQKYYELIREYL